MEVITLQSEAYQAIMAKMDAIEEQVRKPPGVENILIDNQQFCNQLKVSKRTAQTWRDQGKIAFVQIGTKIYYKPADVLALAEHHYVPGVKRCK